MNFHIIHGMNESRLTWVECEKKQVMNAQIFSVMKSKRKALKDGRQAEYFTMDCADWTSVIALTRDSQNKECFIMVRQFRQGNMKISLEFPGGVVDTGEDACAAAMRELQEETGYVAESLHLLGSLSPNPALFSNQCHSFFAENVSLIGKQNLDSNEILDVVLVPVEEIVHNKEFFHAIMHASLGLFYQYQAKYKEGVGRIRTDE